jgi:hypothetical protein
MKNKFSILVVSWNTKDLLKDCIHSIFQYLEGYTFEVIVVDNNSLDGSRDLLHSLNKTYYNLFVIINSQNVGFAEANNQAFQQAKFETIVLMNPDARLIDSGVIKLVRLVNEDQKIGLLSCRLFNEEVSNQTIHRRLPTLRSVFYRYSFIGRNIDRFIFKNKFEKDFKYLKVSRVSLECIEQPAAALLVFRKKIICFSGLLFDKQFPIYGNDVDLSKRILDFGYNNLVDYTTSIWHKGSSSTASLSNKESTHLRRKWIQRYFLVHFGKTKQLVSKFLLKI